MTKAVDQPPSFNLWVDPWIDLERLDGSFDRQGIAGTLLCAVEYRGFALSSPLETAAVHRLLAAVLQDIIRPLETADLRAFNDRGIDRGKLQAFGEQYSRRFDLFSLEQPFMQSSDLPLLPEKKTPTKTVAYLAPDFPSGTGVIHYRHSLEDRQAFCPACCARGLVCIPAFATSGGAGIKPSINGVPPLYVLPQGTNLLDTLAASLVLRPYQPAASAPGEDLPWWRGQNIVTRSQERTAVGYLQSLTFPARRVRLHPELNSGVCTRCGQPSGILVRTMVYEMGEFYDKGVPWLDPFAAYTQKGKDTPNPVRPISGRAAWREFGSLFLKHPPEPVGKGRLLIRPALIDQIENTGTDLDGSRYSFRCIGLRTDMKAKIFEWVDNGFEVPGSLLHSVETGLDIEEALGFAGECDFIMGSVLKEALNHSQSKGTRHAQLRQIMKDAFWMALAVPFREGFIPRLAAIYAEPNGDQRKTVQELYAWKENVVQIASRVFAQTVDQIGDGGRALHQIYAASDECNRHLFGRLKKEKPEDE